MILSWAGGLALTALAASETPATLDPVVVTANPSAQPASALPYSVGVIDGATIEDAGPRVSLSEALSRVPGIAAASRNNYAQDQQISSRGFGARAGFGVRGLRLYEDGIPATAPDGQGQVAHFNLADTERIEVLRGPFSTLYGNASGGVIASFTRAPARDALGVEADAGSFGLREYRLRGEAVLGEQWSTRGSATRFDIEGFRPHSGASRQLYSAQLRRRGVDDTLAMNAGFWDQPAQDPLGLTRAQFDADPRQTAPQATQFDTRKNAHQAQVGASWSSGGLAISYYGGTRSVTQWLAIPVATQANPNHSGGVVDFDRRYTGLDARYTVQLSTLALTGGLAADLQDEDRRGYENFIGTQLGVTGALRRDENNRVHDLDEYLEASWRPADAWSTLLGARHGEVHFRSKDHYLGNGDDSGSLRYAYTVPAAGIVFKPATDWSLRASAGAGYETPTFNELAYRPDGTSGYNTALQAQTSRQLELGAAWRTARASADLAIFAARGDHELVVLTNAGGRSSFGNAGRTGRRGAELGAQWRVADTWSSHLAFTWLDARYREAFVTCGAPPCTTPTVPVADGNRLPGVPRLSSFIDLAWTPAPFAAAIEWQTRSRVAVNDVNSDFASGFGLVALRADYALPLWSGLLRLGARIDNVFDRAYAGSVIVNEGNARYFEPGAPRSLLLSVAFAPI